ncbi:hypothetical protein NEUTE1DRAFT_109314 [Neurospora tetrasperma FGSC 2508]|uniref:Uncharacterized protein n=1 Tax=Neurospora tetrasperma (strain FGSC 2508 / ATCC MYA-4615 / P0657) TaxID=510951 RepID=F8MIV2_NEUT8|nr:uncharacterized protein NEUTE1DRAFT_109314 [Neurospora tetrasperma FGSC 2508]EGO59849.1 hypothetical protein NEUTE1DRAFT_109314 [Neurospora tetrasperma FGSC 2508]
MFWGRFPLRSGWMDGWVGGWKMEDGRGGNLKRGEEEDEEEVREGSEADGEMVGIYLYLSGSMVEWMGMLAWYLSTLTLRSPSDSAFKQTTAKLSSEFELKRHGSKLREIVHEDQRHAYVYLPPAVSSRHACSLPDSLMLCTGRVQDA